MGVLTGKDIFSAKWLTAIIFDSGGLAHFVPIKRVLGNYFVTDINNKVYCFEIIDSRVKTYRQTLVRSFRFLLYDTTHSQPISPENNSELDMVLKQNSLPKMNMTLYNILKAIGKKEKIIFEPFQLKSLIEEVSKNQGEYSEQALNLVNYLQNLNITQIVTPVKSITEFIEDDLLATKPGFYGDIVSVYQRADIQNKRINNTEEKGKVAWMKWILIIVVILVIVLFIYHGYTQGWFKTFTDLGSSFSGFQGIPLPGSFVPPGTVVHDDAYYQANYTPETLKAAIDRGEIDINTLPPATKELVKNVQLPTVSP